MRFLSETGEGRVAGFKGKDQVLVEDADGFQIPMLLSEVVVIGHEDYDTAHMVEGRQAVQRGPDTVPERGGARPAVPPAIRRAPAPPEERKGGERLSAYLAFVPMDIHQFTTTRFEAYFVNDSNYYLRLTLLTADGASYRLRHTIEVEPNMQVFLEELGRDDLGQMERLCVQLLAYKRDKAFLPKPALSVQLRLDGVKFYASGDTSTTDDMRCGKLAKMRIDYAAFPGDGFYNMGVAEASECARLVGARHSIPVHLVPMNDPSDPAQLFSREAAEAFQAEGRIILEPGEEMDL